MNFHKKRENMASEKMKMTYTNEDDKAYGLAGMAISLVALDAVDKVSMVSLDGDGPMVTFSHAYYFSGSPSISPKATWNNLVNNYYITSAMVLSNLMSRSIVRLGMDVPAALLEEVRRNITEEGQSTCSLEDDEIDRIYTKTYNYMGRIFRNPRLHPAIDEFVRTISRRRRLSGMELRDELAALNIL